ncbi:hypothetical protein [Streptacidiphilus anmyonensis]|uniref:hypothetical protein n=1 Tax=Streptacidiphilus anmyonensis TaxID=405782 RepID=UPI001364B5DD|nr:hypothetical protein [Streptacidiphilus anmyonensis]
MGWYKLESYFVWIDDVQVARLRHGTEATIPVPLGDHHIQLRYAPLIDRLNFGDKPSEILRFHVEPHQVIRFESQYKAGGILLQRLDDPPAPPPSVSGAGDARVLGVTETKRIEEWLGEDVRLIDNSASPAPVTRSLKASREWTRTLTLGASHSQTVSGEVNANLLWLSAKGSIEAELQRTLTHSIGSTHLFEEEISVTVPERAAVRIVLGWKRIWQCGEARVLLPEGSVHIVPYRVVVSVTFDQKIQDVTGHSEG